MDEEGSTDTFPVHYILLPCFCLSFVINYQFTVMEILWSFSILLEAVAILPQLHMLKRTGQAEALTRYYIISLGTYRALYIFNWVYRYVSLTIFT
jgi:ER lumen protein retaining receptor